MHISKIEEFVKEKFKDHPKRLIHTYGVCEMAVKLAEKFNVDKEKAYIAALCHDICKFDSIEKQIELINDPKIIEECGNATEIYHAYAGANFCKKEFGFDDEIINAIRYHVMGRRNMSKLEEIIYISDYTEKNRKIDSCIKCREMLDTNYEYALYLSYKFVIDYLESIKVKVLDIQYELRDYYYKRSQL